MRRIVVVGCPGSGKSTLAAVLARRLGLVHIELDNLHWRAGWEEAPIEEFQADLAARMAAAVDGWVTCGNYRSRSEGRHVAAADTVVWLDLRKRVVMGRVVKRTLRRAITRERLFGRDVVEPFTNLYRWAPEKNIVRWAWVYYDRYREQYEAAIAEGRWSHATVHRLRSARAVEEFTRSVTA